MSQYRGFSLLELLIVVGLIALLTAVLLPALAASREAAELSACLNNIRQLGTASHVYASDHDGRIAHSPPVPAPPPIMEPGLTLDRMSGGTIWMGSFYTGHGLLLENYAPDPDVFFCPGDQQFVREEQVDCIGTVEPANSAYAYRNLQQTTRSLIHDLGENEQGQEARMLLMDGNIRVPGGGDQLNHLSHEGNPVNVLFLDGHGSAVPDPDGALTINSSDPVTFLSDYSGATGLVLIEADRAE